MTVRPRYYYNLIGNICNENEEFGTRLMHKEDLNEPYIENMVKGSNSLLDLLNQYDKENEQLKKQIHYLKIVCRNELDDGTLKQVMGSLGDVE